MTKATQDKEEQTKVDEVGHEETQEEELNMPYVTSWEKIARKEGKQEGKQEGRVEGKLEEKIETAKKMLKKNLDITIISDITGLSIEEIEKLAETEH